ncbi:MAG: hypothetical protein HZA53_12485 [Planctomycetes bacterium]|nr:hypothetical protein [Planctomycetota bacterium]
MKPALLIPLTLAASVAASLVVCKTVANDAPAPALAAPASADFERLAAELRALREGQAALGRELAAVKGDVALRSGGETRVPLAEIDAAVQRAVAARLASEGASAEPKPDAAPVKKQRGAAEFLAALEATNGDWDAAQKLWKELREAGLVDGVLALVEERAKDRPNDAAAQVELGKAYLQKLFTVPAGPEQGLWATKADQAFDAALGIDDHDWSARFNKAVSLSNWPAFLGKQGAAAKHFETLIEQQSQGAARPEHAQTYFFLGNLYQSMGKSELAVSTWSKGLERFPDNAQLQNQVRTAQGH